MQSTRILPAATFLAALATSPALAEGDESAGWALATEHCARCHDIAAAGAAKEFPPSFASIAVFRAPEQIYARIVMPSAHSGMSEVALYLLSRMQIDDLVAYIRSLEPVLVEDPVDGPATTDPE